KPYQLTSKQSSSTRSNASTKFKGKEIANPITPPFESASEEDSDLEQAQRDKTGQKPKRVKDFMYHKEKKLLCKQAEKDSGTDTEPLEQVQNHAEYNVFANVRQHSEQPESTSNTCLVEKDDSNVTPDSPNMCDNDIQTDQNAEDEFVTLANLIANLKLDIDENKTIQKQLKKENASLTQELKECKSTLAETSRTLEESNSIRDSCLIALQNKQTELEKYMTFND
ncbi:hypothetical protein Tco_0095479, partial [Tanacetum coccineum]